MSYKVTVHAHWDAGFGPQPSYPAFGIRNFVAMMVDDLFEQMRRLARR